jgi:hypothetical protein
MSAAPHATAMATPIWDPARSSPGRSESRARHAPMALPTPRPNRNAAAMIEKV